MKPSSQILQLSASLSRPSAPWRGLRGLHASARSHFSTAQATGRREYFYTVDHLGQVYLEDTRIRNFTSCLKDRAFLDLFYRRMRYNTEYPDRREQGWPFWSLCQGEANFVRPDPDVTVLVFQKLVDDHLTYAGTMSMPFEPASLRAAPDTGYLYHPSPIPPASNTRRRQRKTTEREGQGGEREESKKESPYGPYSLLRSSIVLDHFAQSLEMDENGATFEYKGKKYDIGVLPAGGVLR